MPLLGVKRPDSGGTAPLLFICAVLITAVTQIAAAPLNEDTSLETTDGRSGCYYNFQHYGEGDRIMTNEPCLNCTCHNRMLMCYLRVCPFTKPIGQDCTIEKRGDQCCPVITCPDVRVDLLTTSTISPEAGVSDVGHLDQYGCMIDNRFYSEGAQVPKNPDKPCELRYCIRNMTACVMQECTLHVDGCTPVYHRGVCCPVRYSCEHPDEEIPLMIEETTTVKPTPGFVITTTVIPGASQSCNHDDFDYPDGASITTERHCEHCYCMKGHIVCAVQECGMPMENEGKNCTALPPREGQCCPDTYVCEDIFGTTIGFDFTTEAHNELSETLATSITESGIEDHEKEATLATEEESIKTEEHTSIPPESTEISEDKEKTTISPFETSSFKQQPQTEESSTEIILDSEDKNKYTTSKLELNTGTDTDITGISDEHTTVKATSENEINYSTTVSIEAEGTTLWTKEPLVEIGNEQTSTASSTISEEIMSTTEFKLELSPVIEEQTVHEPEKISTIELSEIETTTSVAPLAINEQDNEIIEEINVPHITSRIPGEGNCLVDGVTYSNNSDIPVTSKCQTLCRCVSSIVRCDSIPCGPPPPNKELCQPVYNKDACCPTYTCIQTTPEPPSSDNQMTKSPESSETKQDSGCAFADCVVSTDLTIVKPSDESTENPQITLPPSDQQIIEEECGKSECRLDNRNPSIKEDEASNTESSSVPQQELEETQPTEKSSKGPIEDQTEKLDTFHQTGEVTTQSIEVDTAQPVTQVPDTTAAEIQTIGITSGESVTILPTAAVIEEEPTTVETFEESSTQPIQTDLGKTSPATNQVESSTLELTQLPLLEENTLHTDTKNDKKTTINNLDLSTTLTTESNTAGILIESTTQLIEELPETTILGILEQDLESTPIPIPISPESTEKTQELSTSGLEAIIEEHKETSIATESQRPENIPVTTIKSIESEPPTEKELPPTTENVLPSSTYIISEITKENETPTTSGYTTLAPKLEEITTSIIPGELNELDLGEITELVSEYPIKSPTNEQSELTESPVATSSIGSLDEETPVSTSKAISEITTITAINEKQEHTTLEASSQTEYVSTVAPTLVTEETEKIPTLGESSPNLQKETSTESNPEIDIEIKTEKPSLDTKQPGKSESVKPGDEDETTSILPEINTVTSSYEALSTTIYENEQEKSTPGVLETSTKIEIPENEITNKPEILHETVTPSLVTPEKGFTETENLPEQETVPTEHTIKGVEQLPESEIASTTLRSEIQTGQFTESEITKSPIISEGTEQYLEVSSTLLPISVESTTTQLNVVDEQTTLSLQTTELPHLKDTTPYLELSTVVRSDSETTPGFTEITSTEEIIPKETKQPSETLETIKPTEGTSAQTELEQNTILDKSQLSTVTPQSESASTSAELESPEITTAVTETLIRETSTKNSEPQATITEQIRLSEQSTILPTEVSELTTTPIADIIHPIDEGLKTSEQPVEPVSTEQTSQITIQEELSTTISETSGKPDNRFAYPGASDENSVDTSTTFIPGLTEKAEEILTTAVPTESYKTTESEITPANVYIESETGTSGPNVETEIISTVLPQKDTVTLPSESHVKPIEDVTTAAPATELSTESVEVSAQTAEPQESTRPSYTYLPPSATVTAAVVSEIETEPFPELQETKTPITESENTISSEELPSTVASISQSTILTEEPEYPKTETPNISTIFEEKITNKGDITENVFVETTPSSFEYTSPKNQPIETTLQEEKVVTEKLPSETTPTPEKETVSEFTSKTEYTETTAVTEEALILSTGEPSRPSESFTLKESYNSVIPIETTTLSFSRKETEINAESSTISGFETPTTSISSSGTSTIYSNEEIENQSTLLPNDFEKLPVEQTPSVTEKEQTIIAETLVTSPESQETPKTTLNKGVSDSTPEGVQNLTTEPSTSFETPVVEELPTIITQSTWVDIEPIKATTTIPVSDQKESEEASYSTPLQSITETENEELSSTPSSIPEEKYTEPSYSTTQSVEINKAEEASSTVAFIEVEKITEQPLSITTSKSQTITEKAESLVTSLGEGKPTEKIDESSTTSVLEENVTKELSYSTVNDIITITEKVEPPITTLSTVELTDSEILPYSTTLSSISITEKEEIPSASITTEKEYLTGEITSPTTSKSISETEKEEAISKPPFIEEEKLTEGPSYSTVSQSVTSSENIEPTLTPLIVREGQVNAESPSSTTLGNLELNVEIQSSTLSITESENPTTSKFEILNENVVTSSTPLTNEEELTEISSYSTTLKSISENEEPSATESTLKEEQTTQNEIITEKAEIPSPSSFTEDVHVTESFTTIAPSTLIPEIEKLTVSPVSTSDDSSSVPLITVTITEKDETLSTLPVVAGEKVTEEPSYSTVSNYMTITQKEGLLVPTPSVGEEEQVTGEPSYAPASVTEKEYVPPTTSEIKEEQLTETPSTTLQSILIEKEKEQPISSLTEEEKITERGSDSTTLATLSVSEKEEPSSIIPEFFSTVTPTILITEKEEDLTSQTEFLITTQKGIVSEEEVTPTKIITEKEETSATPSTIAEEYVTEERPYSTTAQSVTLSENEVSSSTLVISAEGQITEEPSYYSTLQSNKPTEKEEPSSSIVSTSVEEKYTEEPPYSTTQNVVTTNEKEESLSTTAIHEIISKEPVVAETEKIELETTNTSPLPTISITESVMYPESKPSTGQYPTTEPEVVEEEILPEQGNDVETETSTRSETDQEKTSEEEPELSGQTTLQSGLLDDRFHATESTPSQLGDALTSGYGQPEGEMEYDEHEPEQVGPGTCRYGGKVYVSAQQIPRDDPCDFCFCFRSDIICLQQSCPPPIHGCHEEPIQGFCCPRYECPVSMATALNVTTTTTTTTTTLPPHFLPHAYKGAARRQGCQIKGHAYKVGEVVRSSSGPCLHCTCGGDGQMKCEPKVCTPEPMLRQMIAAAVSSKRRR